MSGGLFCVHYGHDSVRPFYDLTKEIRPFYEQLYSIIEHYLTVLEKRKPALLRLFQAVTRVLRWRSKRDLNSRGPFGPYALSRGASSTS